MAAGTDRVVTEGRTEKVVFFTLPVRPHPMKVFTLSVRPQELLMLLMRVLLLVLFASFAYLVVRSFSPFAGVLTVAVAGGALIAFLMAFFRRRAGRP